MELKQNPAKFYCPKVEREESGKMATPQRNLDLLILLTR